jgi:hypothetical protein
VVIAALLTASLLPKQATAQQRTPGQSAGVVTALQGQATVGRVATPQPVPLKFKDDLFFRDQISTKERSTVRVLLGGKGTLTIREQSQVTLDESVAPDGGRQSIISVLGGKVAAAIARALMGSGEAVEVRTPNAVAAVRGTVLIAEYIPPATSAEAPKPILLASADPSALFAQAIGTPGGTSNFTVLSGSVVVSVAGQPPMSVGAMQTVQVRMTPQGTTQVSPPRPITSQQAQQAAQGLQAGKSHKGEADSTKSTQAQTQQAAAVASAIVTAVTGEPAPATGASQPQTQEGSAGSESDSTLAAAAQGTTSGTINDLAGGAGSAGSSSIGGTTTGTTSNSTVADIAPPVQSLENILPAGTLITVTGSSSVAPGASLATFSAGPVNTVPAVTAPPSVTAPLAAATGAAISHSGTLVELGPGALLYGSGTTPFIQATGTTFTNSGSLYTLAAGSAISNGPALVSASGGGVFNLSGPAISSTNGVIDLNDPIFIFSGGSALTLTGTAILLNGGSLMTTGGLWRSDESGNQITVGGTLLDATGATITFRARTTSETTGSLDKVMLDPGAGKPQIRLVGSSYTDLDPEATLVELPKGGTTAAPTTYAGLLLASANSTISIPAYSATGRGWLLDLCCSGALQTTESVLPLIGITRSVASTTEDAKTYGDLLGVFGQSLTLGGPLFSAAGTAGAPVRLASTTGSLLAVMQGTKDGVTSSAKLTSTTSKPLLDLNAAEVKIPAPVVWVGYGSQVSLAGSLLTATDGVFNVIPPSTTNIGFLVVSPGGSIQTTASTAPLVTFQGGSVVYGGSAGANSVGIGVGDPASPTASMASITALGGLVKATGTTFGTGSSMPYTFIELSHSSLSTGGPILDLASVNLNLGSTKPVMRLAAGSSVTVGANPAIRMVGGSLTAYSLVQTDGSANSFTFGGSVLDLSGGAEVTLQMVGEDPTMSTDISSINLPTGVPFVRMTDSSMTINGSGEPFIDPDNKWTSDNSVKSLGLIAVNTSGTSRVLSLGGPLLRLWAVNLTAAGETSPSPYVQIEGMDVSRVYPSVIEPLIMVKGAASEPSTTARPLLFAKNTYFMTGQGFFFGMDGSKLTSTAAASLLILEGGSLSIGAGSQSALGLQSGTQLSLVGGFLETTGTSLMSYSTYGVLGLLDSTLAMSGSSPLLKLSGGAASSPPSLPAPLISVGNATGTIPNELAPNINLTGTGNLAQVDYMLMSASVPIIQALNGAINVNGDPGNLVKGALAIGNQSQVSAQGAVWLDNSFLRVNNGPLLSVTGGAQMTTSGDFATLANGSKITVQNGPLIYVDGAGSKLNVTGGLINFSGSGNQVILNNSLTPTHDICGVPVQQPTLGNVSLGPYPIKNTSGGTVKVNNSTVTNTGVPVLTPSNFTGSVIRVTNGGQVTVTAPAP